MDKMNDISAADQIVRDILRGLYESRFVPGQRLVEPDLMDFYGVSRTTVRDALKKLSALGVLETQHNRGARVRSLNAAEAKNILMLAEVLSGLAARQAASRVNQGENIERVKSLLRDVEVACAQSDKLEFMRSRSHFHRGLARIGENPELERLLSTLQVHLIRNTLVMEPEIRWLSYKKIGSAVLSGDVDAAEGAARAHVREVLKLLEDRGEWRR